VNILLLELLELLPLMAGSAAFDAGRFLVEGDLGGRDGSSLFLEGCSLKGLEFGKGSLELAR
jgi:hypothetical protein